MHCRSFFDRCCAHCCCVHFLAFICYGARTSGRRPCPGLGEDPRVRFWSGAPGRSPIVSRESFLECERLQEGDDEGSGSTGYLCSTLLLYRPKCTSRRLGMERQLVFALRMHGRTAAAIGACGLSP